MSGSAAKPLNLNSIRCKVMRIALLITSVTLSFITAAQPAREFSFKSYSILNGLASNTVRAVTQDRDGFIWIATRNGLQRFDGSGFITFNGFSQNGPSPLTETFSFYQDRKQQLWLVSDKGAAGRFDTRRFQYLPALMAGSDYVSKLFELPSGVLMGIKVREGFMRYDEKKNMFVPDEKSVPLPPRWKPNEIAWDSVNKSFWITCDSGLVQYNTATKALNYRGHNPENNPVISAFSHYREFFIVFADKWGNLLLNRWPKNSGTAIFYRYHKDSNKVDSTHFANLLGYHETKGFLQQRNGRFWLFGMPFLGEWSMDRQQIITVPNVYKNEQSIKYDYAYSACEDRESNIWIATDNGLFCFNPDDQIFDTYSLVRTDNKPPFEANVHVMQELDNGNILVGCWGAGLVYYDKNFKAIPLPKGLQPLMYGTSAWDMAIHPKTRELWITLQGGGLIVYDQKKDTYKEFFPDIFEGATIRQVDEDTTGNLWFGTQKGHVVKWDAVKAGGDPTKGFELICKTGQVLKVHYDYAGYIYAGTNGRGLLKIDAKTGKVVKTFTDKGLAGERLFTNSPGDMTYYDDSTLVISAGCINVLNTKTGKIRFISTADGLPSNSTESVERDESGIIWAGMTNGICRLNLKRGIVTYYDRRDGIPYDKFSQAGVKELHDGRLAFFTDHNFMVFDPNRFGQSVKPPRPMLTSFTQAGRRISYDSLMKMKNAVLPYNNNSISFSFSALSFLPQQKIHYYYQLEGFDTAWIKTDKPVEVSYNYLPPGHYTLLVRSGNADGLINEEGLKFPVTVREPFWKTWWFFSLVSLAVIAMLYLLDRERMKRLRSMQLLRRQIRGNLKDEVSITLNNINVLSEMAKIKADKNLEQAKTYIDQISDKSRTMMDVMDDTLWSIDPQNDSMSQMLLRIHEVTEGWKVTHDADIDLIVDKKVQTLRLDMKVRHDLFFFYKEALQYIVTQMGNRQIFINIKMAKGKLLLEILAEARSKANDDMADRFAAAMDKRVASMPATLDVLVDGQSFSALLSVDVREK